jgi:hypothetical protein
MCLLKYIFYCEQHFAFFIFRSRLSDMRINSNRIREGLLYFYEINKSHTFILHESCLFHKFYTVYLYLPFKSQRLLYIQVAYNCT